MIIGFVRRPSVPVVLLAASAVVAVFACSLVVGGGGSPLGSAAQPGPGLDARTGVQPDGVTVESTGGFFEASATTASFAASLADRVSVVVQKRGHKTVRDSIGVWDAATGRRLYMRHADRPRRTASVMKLATTVAALLALGPDHEMAIDVRAMATPRSGVIDGDLIVEGTGDPGLSSHLDDGGADAAIARLAQAVRASGVTRVTGDLILDTSAFAGDARHPGWGWKPGDYSWYMASVSALTIADGCVDVTAAPGPGDGAPARLTTVPAAAPVSFVNRLTTTTQKKKHLVVFDPPDAEGRIPARGKVYQEYSVPLACADPPEVFGAAFRRALSDAGIVVAGNTRIVRGPPAAPWPRAAGRPGVVLARHATRLADAIRITNHKSQNLWAELILRSVGAFSAEGVRGGDGSFAGGARAVRAILWPKGNAPSGFSQEDGSGLSRGNRATVGALADVLLRVYRSDHRLVFMDSLAKGGEPDGTLRKRFKDKRFAGRVLAKTGTLRDTSALAGFVRVGGGVGGVAAGTGRVLIFVILCEGPVGRSRVLQDAVVGALLKG